MATVAESVERIISIPPVDGWETRVISANNRNLPWEDIACELVDNARTFHKPNEPAVVWLSWHTLKTRRFECIDCGIGGSEPEPFLQPGNSAGHELEGGNSTFGTGLFAVECHLKSKMQIATFPQCGPGLAIAREISRGRKATSKQIGNDDGTRIKWGVPNSGGTRVLFDGVKKSMPNASTVSEIAESLGRRYSYAIRGGELQITLVRNGTEVEVRPSAMPSLEGRHTETIESKGHTFTAVWGLTSSPNTTPGVELVYGGKQFDVTAIPCGEYNVKHFFGSITIPRSFGKESMDLLKRNIDNEMMSEVYDRCFELFEECLKQSHARSTTKELEDLNNAIAKLLSDEAKSQSGDESEGTKDKRKFNGRDEDGVGVKPQQTGKTRRGRRGGASSRKSDQSIDVKWQPLTEQKPIANYEPASNRLTFNEDNSKAMAWRESGQTQMLGVVGAAFMAQQLKNNTGYGDFGYYMTKFCGRLS